MTLSSVLTIKDGEIVQRKSATVLVCAHCEEQVELLVTPDYEESFHRCENCGVIEGPVKEIEVEE